MKMQKVKNHKIEEDSEECFVSEECNTCGVEMVNIKEIRVGTEDDLYYCQDCCSYHNIKTKECKEMII